MRPGPQGREPCSELTSPWERPSEKRWWRAGNYPNAPGTPCFRGRPPRLSHPHWGLCAGPPGVLGRQHNVHWSIILAFPCPSSSWDPLPVTCWDPGHPVLPHTPPRLVPSVPSLPCEQLRDADGGPAPSGAVEFPEGISAASPEATRDRKKAAGGEHGAADPWRTGSHRKPRDRHVPPGPFLQVETSGTFLIPGSKGVEVSSETS